MLRIVFQDVCNREGFAVSSLTLSAASGLPVPTDVSISGDAGIFAGLSTAGAPAATSAPGSSSGVDKLRAVSGGVLSLVAASVVLFV